MFLKQTGMHSVFKSAIITSPVLFSTQKLQEQRGTAPERSSLYNTAQPPFSPPTLYAKVLWFLEHTCQPSRSRRDSPGLETETRRPARRPKKPIRPVLSRSTPKNRILNLLFACSLCSSVGIQVSSVSFGLFSCTRPW